MSDNQFELSTADSDEINYELGPIRDLWWWSGLLVFTVVLISGLNMGWPFYRTFIAALGVFTFWCCLTAWASKRHAVERSACFRAIAEKLGLDYGPLAPPDLLQGAAVTKLFGNFPQLRAENFLTGTFLGKSIKVFDLHAWDPHRGESGAGFSITVVTFPNDLHVPDFELRPLGILRRFARMFKGSGIKLSGTITKDQFSFRYDLRGKRESEIIALFDGPAIAYFAQRAGWVVQCVNQKLFVWREGPGSHDKLVARRHFQLTSETRGGADRKLVATDELVRLLERTLCIREIVAEQRKV